MAEGVSQNSPLDMVTSSNDVEIESARNALMSALEWLQDSIDQANRDLAAGRIGGRYVQQRGMQVDVAAERLKSAYKTKELLDYPKSKEQKGESVDE